METLTIFFAGMGIGGILEYVLVSLLLHKPVHATRRFTIAKKVNFFSLPLWGILFVFFLQNHAYGVVFICSAIVGTFLEFVMAKGAFYLYGVKIWVYKQGSLGGYTSIYSIPYWGAAGIIFVSLGKILGI